jgi:hypothetical protein
MEILKFSEPPRRSAAPRQRSGFKGIVGFALAVLIMGGMSTTLAGTVTLNSGGSVEFGQGIVTTAACDESISIIPAATYDSRVTAGAPAGSFFVTSITVKDIGVAESDSLVATLKELQAGCLGKNFTIRGFDGAGNQVKLDDTANDLNQSVSIRIPGSFANATDTSTVLTKIADAANGTLYAASIQAVGPTVSVINVGGFTAKNEVNTSAAGTFTITGLKVPSNVVRFTLETSQ